MTHHETKRAEAGRKPCSCQCEAKPDPCREDDSGPPYPDDCCELTCFERPNYFCGHLLTAEDLAAEQRYLIEKNKLRNRALYGSGVVCGLRLTCHPDCRGYIRIGEGYALDACGHDLVVCAPAQFDVIGALRDKGCLPVPAKRNPSARRTLLSDECHDERCYHIAICYRERQKGFETPFSSNGCHDRPQECQPTRVSETFVIQLLTEEELPIRRGLSAKWDDLAESGCTLFESGGFYEILQEHRDGIQIALAGEAGMKSHLKFAQIFAALRTNLRLHLDQHPESFRCRLKREIDAIRFPEDEDDFPNRCRDAFQGILDRGWTHYKASGLGDMVFECAAPCHADCVVLGSVVVADHSLRSVCNCPRDYVWTPGNVLDVAAYYLYGREACSRPSRADRESTAECCRTWDFAWDEFRTRNQPTLLRPAGAFAQEVREFESSIAGRVKTSESINVSEKMEPKEGGVSGEEEPPAKAGKKANRKVKTHQQ